KALTEAGGGPHLVHVSTAYVGGMLRGLVREELPLDPGLNWRHEAEVLSTLRPAVEEESRRPEVLERLQRQARSRLGPAGTPSQARAVERLRQRWVRDRRGEVGRHAEGAGAGRAAPRPGPQLASRGRGAEHAAPRGRGREPATGGPGAAAAAGSEPARTGRHAQPGTRGRAAATALGA